MYGDERARAVPECLAVEFDGEPFEHPELSQAVHPGGDGRWREVDRLGDLAVGLASVLREQPENLAVGIVESAHTAREDTTRQKFRGKPNQALAEETPC